MVYLEPNQKDEFNKICFNEEYQQPYFDDAQKEKNFYSNFDDDDSIKKLKSKKQLFEGKEPNTNGYEKNYPKRQNFNVDKVKISHLKGKKRKRSPKQKPKYKTNYACIKYDLGNNSRYIPPKKLFSTKKYEKVNTTINGIQTKKEEELNMTFTQAESNKSTESTESKASQLSKESEHRSIQSEMNAKIILYLEKAHELPENQNIDKNIFKTNLKKFLRKKEWGYMLKKNNLNENEETKISPLDYYNILISMNPQIQPKDKDDILVKLCHLINILKDKKSKKPKKNKNKRNSNLKKQIEEKENLNVEIPLNELSGPSDLKIDKLGNFYEFEEDIKRENRKSNLWKIMKNRIIKRKKEDSKKVSELHELQKKEYIQSKEKDNNETESDFSFFNNNFESYFEEHDKIFITDEELKDEENEKETFDELNKITQEKNPEDDLIKIFGKDQPDKMMKVKFEKTVEEEDQQIKYKREKCRIKLYKLYQSNNFEELLKLSDQFYIDKQKDKKDDKKIRLYIKIPNHKEFENRVREIEGYNNFTLALSKRENEDIQSRAKKLEEIIPDLIDSLNIPKKEKKSK